MARGQAAKRYQVTKRILLGTPDDPTTPVVDTQVDLALLLSQRLQKMVRQGRSFRLHRVQAQLVPTGGDLDMGVAFNGNVYWAPATKNSVRAWQMLQKTWAHQKRLNVGAMGPVVRGDDFEVAWTESHQTTRTSNIIISDDHNLLDGSGNVEAAACLYGDSTDGGIFPGDAAITLEDVFNSALSSQQVIGISKFWNGQTVKDAKWTYQFPKARYQPISCHWSAINDQGGLTGGALLGFDSGATVSYQDGYITDGAMCTGVCRIEGWMLPENTIEHIQDQFWLEVTFTVSMGYSLMPRKSGTRKRTARKTTARRASSGRKYRRRR